MEENKRKAMNEKDPAQKALLLQLIEDDGKKLKANMKKQQELSNKFNFDPNKRIDDLVESIKEAIKNGGRDGSGGGGSGRNKNKNDNDDDNDNNGGSGSSSTGDGSGSGGEKDKNQDLPQNNQQLIIIVGLAALVIFYLMNQKQEKEPNYYDF